MALETSKAQDELEVNGRDCQRLNLEFGNGDQMDNFVMK